MHRCLMFIFAIASLLFVGCGDGDDFGTLTYFSYVNSTSFPVSIEKKHGDGSERVHEINSGDSIYLPTSMSGVIPFMDDSLDSSLVVLRFKGDEERCYIYPLKKKIENDIRFIESYAKNGDDMRFVIKKSLYNQAELCLSP